MVSRSRIRKNSANGRWEFLRIPLRDCLFWTNCFPRIRKDFAQGYCGLNRLTLYSPLRLARSKRIDCGGQPDARPGVSFIRKGGTPMRKLAIMLGLAVV